MKGIASISGLISGLLTAGIVLPAFSQVSSDNTTNTIVNQSGNNFDILNGIQKGNNLFHSFDKFSIPKGGSATFNNSTDVVNIINRVTGGSISNIDGLIKANGNANLFLINPAGIVFGENARLDTGGSFFASTASSILFEDEFEFSAINPQNQPLLTISAPVGLQMGKNPGAIEVNGNGHNLTTQSPYFRPYFPTGLTTGLQVKPGKTLALVGGGVNLNGGLLTAPNGRIELGSVAATGQVGVNSQNGGFTLDYTNTPSLGNIQLSQKSLLNVSGNSTSSIQVQGKRIGLSDGSIIWSQNLGIQPGGDINIRATELLELNGTTADERLRSGIVSETLGLGTSSNINITTAGLTMKNGAGINNRTYTPAPSGNVSVNATEFIQMQGASPKTGLNNVLGTDTLFVSQQQEPISTAKAGDVTVSTPSLSMADGSYISSLSLSDSSGGDIRINTDAIEMIGGTSNSYYGFLATAISGVGYRRGNSGTITLNTKTLTINDGGVITTTNLGSGNASDVTINATELVGLKGFIPATVNEIFISNISSTVGTPSNLIQQIANYEALGNSGNVIIRTPVLKVSDRAGVSVQNFGIGTAGKLTIDADSIQLNRGTIRATTTSGEGGNINLNLQKLLLMRDRSQISAEAMGISNTGNGGNITINSPVIAGFENSDISANAVEGNGGNINIATQGIFGLKFRDSLTEESDITASSEFGVNGTVDINNFGIDPSSGLVELNLDLADSSQQIASGCSNNTGNTFVATGRGGIPQNPNDRVSLNMSWSDIRDLSAYRKRKNNIQISEISDKPAIVEATGFIRNQKGKIELVAVKNKPLKNNQLSNCTGI